MSGVIIDWLKKELTKFENSDVTKTVESEVEAIGDFAYNYIKDNGLTAVYNIASTALLGVATGTPYVTLLASVVKQAEQAGITIAKGAESIVVAQAQADLIAAGKLIAPSTGVVVTTKS